MDDTPNLKLPVIAAAQAQKHVTHNEALRALDALVQLSVETADRTTPPADPQNGAHYIVATGATDVWTGHDDEIAAWQDGTWVFFAPNQGWLAWVGDEDLLHVFDGSAWTPYASGLTAHPRDELGALVDPDGGKSRQQVTARQTETTSSTPTLTSNLRDQVSCQRHPDTIRWKRNMFPSEPSNRTSHGTQEGNKLLESSILIPNVVLGARNDGLGERLKAIVNAMLLASAYQREFRFLWPIRKDMHESHAILPAKEFFSKEFNSKFLISGTISKLSSHPYGEMGWLTSDGISSTAVLAHQYQLPREVMALAGGEIEGRSAFGRHFDRIGFAPHMAAAVDAARAVKLRPGFTAIHLRAGDIIEGRFRFEFDRFIRKAFPFTLAAEVIAQEKQNNRDVIIFGQNAEVCRLLAERNDSIFAGDLARDLYSDQTQIALFEIVLMSRAEKIIAGNSGFSELSAFIGGTTPVNAWGCIDRKNMAEITERILGGADYEKIPALQRSYARWCWIYDNRKTMSAASMRDELRKALKDDPRNGLYQFFLARAVMQADGPAAAETCISEAITDDAESFVGNQRIGGIAHILRMQPNGRLLAEPYLPALMEPSPDRNRPFTAFATGISLASKPEYRSRARPLLELAQLSETSLPPHIRRCMEQALSAED